MPAPERNAVQEEEKQAERPFVNGDEEVDAQLDDDDLTSCSSISLDDRDFMENEVNPVPMPHLQMQIEAHAALKLFSASSQ